MKDQQKSVKETSNCILETVNYQKNKLKQCPFPCTEMNLATVTTFRKLEQPDMKEEQQNSSLFYHLEIQLQNVDSYKIVEEKALYPWDQMACEIGGFLGLVMGASMLSFIEIFACTYFYSLKKVQSPKLD